MSTQIKKIAPTPDEGFASGAEVPDSFSDCLGDCWDGVEHELGFYITEFPLELIDKWRDQPGSGSWGEVHPDGSCIDEFSDRCGSGDGCLITSYVEAMSRGDVFPSIEVIYRPAALMEKTFLDEGAHVYAPWLVEGGFHRNSAWRLAGYTHATAVIWADSAEDLEAAKKLLLD